MGPENALYNNVQFEPHEWAIIVLLKEVKDWLITPKLEHWEAALNPLAKNHGIFDLTTDKKLVLCKNLSAAFLNLRTMLSDENDNKKKHETQMANLETLLFSDEDHFEEEIKGFSEGQETAFATILELLRQKGHLLFNSYYYTVINAFGESSLVPIIPGYKPNQKDYDASILPFLYENKLPFRIDAKHIATYASLVLPCSGGLTPHYYDLVANYEKEDLRIFNIPYFLADLRILLKKEDLVQGHLSALGFIISGKEKGNHGAFVLTCLMPKAFTDGDENIINKINNDLFQLQILSAFEQKPVLSKTGIRIDFIENKYFKELGHNSQLIKEVRNDLPNTFLDTKNSTLGFKVHFNSENGDADKEEGLVAIAVNMEGTYRILKSIFPSGPWLDRGLVCDGQKPYPIRIEGERSLPHLCGGLESLRLLGGASLSGFIKEFPMFLDAFTLLLPEVSANLDDSTEPVISLEDCLHSHLLNDDYSLLIVKDPNISVDIKTEALQKMFEPIFEQQRKMPDGENSVFGEAQEKWVAHQYRKYEKIIDEPNQGDGGIRFSLYDSIKTLIKNNTGIRAVMFLRLRKTYFPQSLCFDIDGKEQGIPSLLKDTYLSYPSFWLFEKLNHVFQGDDISTESFDEIALPDGITKGFTSAVESGYPEVHVTLGVKDETELFHKEVVRALTYFGMRVTTWQKCGKFSGVVIKVQDKYFHVNPTKNELSKAYRYYLTQVLTSAGKIESFKTIFSHYSETAGIMAIHIETAGPTDVVKHTLHFSNGSSLKAGWKSNMTSELELCCIDDFKIREALRKNKNFWKTKESIDCPDRLTSESVGLTKENEKQNSLKLLEGRGCPTIHCMLRPIRINAGINQQQHDLDKNGRKHICDIAKKIKVLEDNNKISQDRERASLLPQVSHAMGTELSALAGALALCSQKLRDSESIRLVRIYGNVRRRMAANNVTTLQELENIEQENEKLLRAELTPDEKKLLSLLVDKRESDQHEDYFRTLATAFSNQFGLPDVRNFFLALLFRTESARDKNRAVLRLGTQEAKITFSPTGEYDLEECLYSAIIIALQHFFSLTILRPASLFQAGDFVETAYEDAFRHYWGENTKIEALKEEIELWAGAMLYAKKENYKQNFKDWESNYMKLMHKLCTPFIHFDISDMPPLKFTGGVGNLLLNIGFQELVLNYLKYSGIIFEGEQKILRISIRSEANGDNYGLKMFRTEAKCRANGDAAKADGKGGQLIDTVLQGILGLRRPASGHYRFIEQGLFVTHGEV